MMVTEQFIGSVQIIMRSDSERMNYHVRSEVDVLCLEFFQNIFNLVYLGFNRVHVFVKEPPVQNIFFGSIRQSFLSIPIKSEFTIHSNIALVILADKIRRARSNHRLKGATLNFRIVDQVSLRRGNSITLYTPHVVITLVSFSSNKGRFKVRTT